MIRRMRKQPIAGYSAWDMDCEPGDRVFKLQGDGFAHIYDLRESTGRDKRDAGELTPRLVKKNGKPRRARMRDDLDWYWAD